MCHVDIFILKISEIPILDKLKTANIFQNSLTYNQFSDYIPQILVTL
jgi:hypothetical protein